MSNEIKLKDFKAFLLGMFAEKLAIKADKDALTERNKKFSEMKRKALDYLEDHKLKNFDTGVGKIITVTRDNVAIEDRGLFFAYLKEKGLFDDMITINSTTLNSFYKDEKIKAKENEDISFLDGGIPGIKEKSSITDISIRGVK